MITQILEIIASHAVSSPCLQQAHLCEYVCVGRVSVHVSGLIFVLDA